MRPAHACRSNTALGSVLTGRAEPQLQPITRGTLQGAWPGFPRGDAQALRVLGTYAYLAIGNGGLAVVDISDPTNLVLAALFATPAWPNA